MTNRHVTPLVPTALLLVLGLAAPAPVHAQGPPSTVEYYHLDALGSVRVVTNQAGAVVSRHDLMPFGEEWQPVTLGREALLFTGKERDYDTGLDYFGARYYRADVGRFTTVDPLVPEDHALADPQLWNRYAYVRNNPLRYTDPDGRCIWDLCAVEGTTAIYVGAAALATAAWLVSPPGQQAVRGVVNDTGTMITTAVGAIGSWFQTERRPGTLGKPDHRQTVEEERERVAGKSEVTIKTPGGAKDSRRADAVGTNPETGTPEVVQVYRPTSGGNVPKREKDAAGDIAKARPDVKVVLIPVRPLPRERERDR
jgi:RHS repeat-associated protein